MIDHPINWCFHLFQHLGMFGAFLSMLIENLGIPLPTEIGYLIGQNSINTGRYAYLFVLAVLTFGHVAGSLISYTIGKLGHGFVSRKIEKKQRIAVVHDKLEGWYAKYGNLTVFLTRFVGYVRPWSSYIAGFAGVEFWTFLAWTALGSLIFNILTLYFTSIFLLVWRRFSTYHFLFIAIGLILFFGLVITELLKYFIRLAKARRVEKE